MQRPVWMLCLAVLTIVWPAAHSSDEIESSISSDPMADQSMTGSLRFYGITKTVKSTTTVVHLYTKYVHATCLFVPLGTPKCAVTTPAPPTTTSTTPQPTTTTSTTTSAPTTSPPFKIVAGQFKPSVSSSITVNKLSLPKLQLNLPQLNTTGLLGGLFNRPSVNMTVAANLTASVGNSGRRRRSEILIESIHPSLVKAVEMTASPELTLRQAIQQDVAAAVEASRAEDYHEYEIVGLMPHHFAERALPFFGAGGRVTIVRLDPVTVTVSQTVTSKFPFDAPTDRVTLAFSGCIPSQVPDLPQCV